MFKALGAKINNYYLFFLFSIKLSTTEGSAKVEVSPKFSKSLEAIFLKILLIIFPDLVFGKPAVITGVHPSPLSASRGFFNSEIFLNINENLEIMGKDKINWKL